MITSIDSTWNKELQHEFQKDYFKELASFIKSAYKENVCYPETGKIYSAFEHCSFDSIKVVIIGFISFYGISIHFGQSFYVNLQPKQLECGHHLHWLIDQNLLQG